MKSLISFTTVALLLATGSAFAAEDAAQPNAVQIQPNAPESDAAQSAQTQPNAAQPDQAQPNAAAQSDQAQPNAAQSDQNAAQSDQAQPNAATQDQAATPSEPSQNQAAAPSESTQDQAAAPSTQDQAATPTGPMSTSPSEELAGSLPTDSLPISDYYNQTVYDSSDHRIGDVNDLLLDKDGKISAAIIGVGGVLGVGEKNVAVPFSLLKVAEKDGSRYLVLEANKEALQSAPSYVYDSGKKVWMPSIKQG
jgi:sporulation protein YlmC with PRC-barrel domain